MAGFNDASNAIAATMGIGVVNVLSTIFAILVIDRIGRRPLLFAGLFGMGISLLFLSTAFSLADVHYLRYAAAVGLFVYVICFAFSLGALFMVNGFGDFPLEVRGSAMSLAVFCCWF